MKKIIGLVVILAVLVLGSYYGMGLLTERTFKRNVDIINQSNGLFVDVEHYNRGWFSSSALVNLSLRFPSHVVKNADGQTAVIPAKEYKVKIPFMVFHGPVMFSHRGVKFGLGYADTQVLLPTKYVSEFNTMYTTASIQPKLNLSLLVNYLDNSFINMDIPAFKLISKNDGSIFDWSGLNTQMNLSRGLHKIKGNVGLDGLQMIKDKVKATFGKMVADYNLHQANGGIYLGEAAFSLPQLVVENGNQKMFALEQWDMHTSSDIQQNLFSSSFTTSFKKLMLHDKQYGPGMLEISVKNLDAPTLAQINQLSNSMQQSSVEARQQTVMGLLPLLPKLLSKGPAIEISKLSLVMPEGVVNGNLLISLPAGEVANPFQMIQKLQGHSTLTVPSKVVREIMLISMRQKLQKPSLQQAMIQQMRTTNAASLQQTTGQVNTTASPSSATTNGDSTKLKEEPTTTTAQPQSAGTGSQTQMATPQAAPAEPQPLTAAEIEQQAAAQTDLRISAMLQSGVLTQQGNDYIIEFSLTQGQLTVNGKPFSAAMLQFQ